MQAGLVKVDLAPTEIANFGRSQAVAIAHEDHGRVAMPAPVVLGRGDQLIDLGGRQILALAQRRIGRAPQRSRADCTVFSGW
jgi:hypothetical protein